MTACVKVTIQCPRCEGTGRVINESFAHNCNLPLADPDFFAGPCVNVCPGYADCERGETIECEDCNGKGQWVYESWNYNIMIQRTEWYGDKHE